MKQEGKRIGGRATRTNAVAAGSVWETRMKMDQVKGGIKVFFNSEIQSLDHPPDPITVSRSSLLQDHDHATTTSTSNQHHHIRKRKSWKQPELESDPIELRKALAELANASKIDEEETTPLCCSFLEERTVFDTDGGGGGREVVEMEMEEEEEEEEEEKKKKGLLDDKEMDLCGEEKLIDKIRDVPISMAAEVGKLEPREEVEDGFEDSVEEQSSRLRCIVDLVMWRDISRSAFVFGMGVFLLISSSCAEDLEFSLISSISYLGLLTVVSVFFYDSFSRETEGLRESDGSWVVEEEEATSFLKLALPYLNEVLRKLRALFSGDPVTTMKLAVILFGLGKCGGQITVWTMGKLAFFGSFTIPRLCASNSDHIRRHGMLCFERMRNAWVSCSYKKLVGFLLFAFFWKISSVTSRLWAVFMLLVSLRYYYEQRLSIADGTPTDYRRASVGVGGSARTATPSEGTRNGERVAAGGSRLQRQMVGATGSAAIRTKQKKRA